MSVISRISPKLSNVLQLKRALQLVWQGSPKWTVASVALVLIQGLLPLVTLYAMKLVVDAVAAGIAAPNKQQAFQHVIWLVVFAGGATLISSMFASVASLVNQAQAQDVTDFMQDTLHLKATEVDLEYYENPEYQNTLHRAQEEAPYRPTHIVQVLAQLGQSIIALLGITALLLSLHWGIIAVLSRCGHSRCDCALQIN